MAIYQHASDWIPGTTTPYSGVIRTADGKFIACAADSPEWQEYLTWAATEGNVPDPFLSPNAGGVAIVPVEDQPVYGSMLESIPVVDPAFALPVMRDVPHVQGSGKVGEALTCTMGNWDGEPTLYEYRWLSDAPADLSAGSSYVVAMTDVGHTICCVVTATNPNGSTAAAPSNGIVAVNPDVMPEPPGTEATSRAVPPPPLASPPRAPVTRDEEEEPPHRSPRDNHTRGRR